MRAAVAEVVCATLEGLDLRYPELGKKEQSQLENYRAQLESER